MNTKEQRLLAIGQAIAKERERRGFSQIEFACMLGHSSHSYISRVECGKQKPSIGLLFAAADVLEVEVRYFFTEVR